MLPGNMKATIGLLMTLGLVVTSSGRTKDMSPPIPTSETIPYVAEVLGATGYEETLESAEASSRKAPDPGSSSWTKKRVQRKLNFQAEGDKELDPEHREYQEYQGVMGRPGVDFPVLQQIPRTKFSCRNVKKSGYYADLETGCQVFHICDGGRKISFLCPNGTIFRQTHLICDWWFRVDCEQSLEQYDESAELLAHDQQVYKKRTEEIANAMKSAPGTTRTPHNRQGQHREEPRLGKMQESTTTVSPGRLSTDQFPGNSNRGQSKHNYNGNGYSAYDVQQNHQLVENESATRTWVRTTPATNTRTQPSSTTNNFPQNSDNNHKSTVFPVTTNHPTQVVQQTTIPRNDQYSFKADNYNTGDSNVQTTKLDKSQWRGIPEEKEQQVLAETASFASNQHRFGNQINQNYYKNNPYPAPALNTFSDTTHDANKEDPGLVNQFNYGGRLSQSKSNGEYVSKGSPETSRTSTFQSTVNTQTVPTWPTTISQSPSQSHNSHMQPYSSLEQNTKHNKPSITQGSTTWWPSTTTLPTSTSNNMDSSLYNSYTAGTGYLLSSLASNPPLVPKVNKPNRGKSVFNVKIKPSKDYSLVELHRQQPTASTPVTSQYNTISTHSLPTTGNFQPSTWPRAEPINHSPSYKYATVNISGNTEEIRPEVVNSLTDPIIAPTSANVLLKFANYFVSREATQTPEVFSTLRPVISDLVIDQKVTSSVDDQTETTIKPITSTNGEDLPSELSENTKDSYSYLFSSPNDQNNDLSRQESSAAVYNLNKIAQSQEILKTTTRPTTTKPTTSAKPTPAKYKPKSDVNKFRDSSDLRELAQVFSRALSAYLEDPETFKEILAQVRPTEPNLQEQTSPNIEDEVLDFSDASQTRLEIPATTEPPSKTNVGDEINIGEINNLVSASKGFVDHSYENNYVSISTSNSLLETVTSSQPRAESPEVTTHNVRFTSDDASYFPTAGSVSDGSRPRYGGFHNNTRWESTVKSTYSSWPKFNVTQSQLLQSTIAFSPVTSYPITEKEATESTTLPGSDAAQQVNNLLGSNNILYGPSTQFTSSSEDDLLSSVDSYEQENLLRASGSQNIVAGQNYVALAHRINNYQKSDSFSYPDDPSATGNGYYKDELAPYFGQQPPYGTVSQPSAFQTHSSLNVGNSQNYSTVINVETQSPINSYAVNNRHPDVRKEFSISDRSDTFADDQVATWSSSSYFTPQYSESTPTSPIIKPTTYHPLFNSATTEPFQYETTTTPTTESSTEGGWTTIAPLSPEEEDYMLAKAKEMFGTLNESTSNKLMEMIHQAESDMEMRKLILLLVHEGNHGTTDTTRARLINALLNNEEEPTTTTIPTTTTSTTTKMKVMKITSMRSSSSSRSLKTRRVDDSSKLLEHSDANEEGKIAHTAKLMAPIESINTVTTTEPPSSTPTKLPYDSDARALELLKTLYNLAAKWG